MLVNPICRGYMIGLLMHIRQPIRGGGKLSAGGDALKQDGLIVNQTMTALVL